jgi:hypothetical protein
MQEFSSLVAHIRNLKSQGVKDVTLSVDYLNTLFENIDPTPATIKKKKAEQNVVNDGGGFDDD